MIINASWNQLDRRAKLQILLLTSLSVSDCVEKSLLSWEKIPSETQREINDRDFVIARCKQ